MASVKSVSIFRFISVGGCMGIAGRGQWATLCVNGGNANGACGVTLESPLVCLLHLTA